MSRVALLGFGLGGSRFHAPLIAATPGLELAAILTRNPRRREEAAAAHPQAALVQDPEDAIARADVVVVATPNPQHVPHALAAVRAGLPVVVDKPIATSAAGARELRDAAAAAGVPVVPYLNRRWDGDFLTAARLLREDRLGTVTRFESRLERWRPAVAGGWKEQEGGGVLLDLGPHLVDQALVLFGPIATVYAEVDARRAGAEVPDDAFLALEHRSGVRTHLVASLLAGAPGPRMRMTGERGTYVVEGVDVQEAALRAGHGPGASGWGEAPQDAWGVVAGGDERRIVRTERGSYEAFYAGLAAMLDGGPPPVDVQDAITGLEILEAAQRSARERAVVALP